MGPKPDDWRPSLVGPKPRKPNFRAKAFQQHFLAMVVIPSSDYQLKFLVLVIVTSRKQKFLGLFKKNSKNFDFKKIFSCKN